MRIGMLVNAAAGRGRAERYARELAPALAGAGHDVEVCHVNPAPVAWDLDEFVSGRALVIAVGGDGTLQSVVDPAVRHDVPVWHAPFGTENLFAREFGMTHSVDAVLGAIDGWDVGRRDVASCGGRTFLLMFSMGFDANVIHRLARLRKGTITHLTYVRPILEEAFSRGAARLTVEVDGAVLVEDRPGLLVVANSRQYALRIDPAPEARPDDGVLDLVFFPSGGAVGLTLWALRSRLRRHLRHRRIVSGRGREVVVRTTDRRLQHQLDGEAAGPGVAIPGAAAFGGGGSSPVYGDSLRIEVLPGALGVLRPRA